MRRAFCLGFLAAGCTAFSAGQTPPGTTTTDGGVALDAGTGMDTGATTEAGAPPSACQTHMQDVFGRTAVVAAPWQQLLAPDPTRVKISGDALDIETKAGAGPEQYMLTTGRFVAPSQLACSFDLTMLSDLNTEDDAPIDLFVVVAKAADGTSTQLHFGYYDTKLVVRDEHFDANGQTCATCGPGLASKPLGITKGEPTKLQVIVGDRLAVFTRQDDSISRPSGLSGAVTAEILMGLWSFSPYGQQVDLDNFDCSLSCP